MKIRTQQVACAIAIVCCITSVAEATPPKVAGKYGVVSYHICQTVFVAPTVTVDKNNNANSQTVVAAFGPQWGAGSNSAGMASVSVGTITFPSTATSSGNATISNIEVVGHVQRFASTGVASDASGFTRRTNTNSGAFSITDTIVTFGGKNFDYSFGDVVNGIARSINLVRRPSSNEYCLDSMTLTKQ